MNQMADVTIYGMLRESVKRFGPKRGLGFKQGKEYAYLTYSELWERVRRFRAGLFQLGIRRGDRVAILSENRPEWAITDLAAQSLGVITVPIYPSLPAEQVRYIV